MSLARRARRQKPNPIKKDIKIPLEPRKSDMRPFEIHDVSELWLTSRNGVRWTPRWALLALQLSLNLAQSQAQRIDGITENLWDGPRVYQTPTNAQENCDVPSTEVLALRPTAIFFILCLFIPLS
jgi:hypothetical protein